LNRRIANPSVASLDLFQVVRILNTLTASADGVMAGPAGFAATGTH